MRKEGRARTRGSFVFPMFVIVITRIFPCPILSLFPFSFSLRRWECTCIRGYKACTCYLSDSKLASFHIKTKRKSGARLCNLIGLIAWNSEMLHAPPMSTQNNHEEPIRSNTTLSQKTKTPHKTSQKTKKEQCKTQKQTARARHTKQRSKANYTSNKGIHPVHVSFSPAPMFPPSLRPPSAQVINVRTRSKEV